MPYPQPKVYHAAEFDRTLLTPTHPATILPPYLCNKRPISARSIRWHWEAAVRFTLMAGRISEGPASRAMLHLPCTCVLTIADAPNRYKEYLRRWCCVPESFKDLLYQEQSRGLCFQPSRCAPVPCWSTCMEPSGTYLEAEVGLCKIAILHAKATRRGFYLRTTVCI